jgi:flagellar basal-body rod modification protein FlgD
MQGIQQVVTGATQLANSATNVAGSLARPRAVTSTSNTGSTGSTGSAATTTSASADSSTITANDFLTLLVAEMKNQDPTQPTDPTQYISQMVSVNSLQQLIGINQGITSLDTATGADPTAPVSGS